MQAQPKTSSPPRRAPPSSSDRARLIKLIHVARRDLALDEPTYRTLLGVHGGAESAAAMSAQQLQKVLEHMKKSGFKVRAKAGTKAQASGAKSPSLASDPQSKKARALWLMLHHIGQVRDPAEAALLAYARRQCGVDRMEWTSDMLPIIESLKAWALRSLPAFVLPYVKHDITAWAGHMSPAWRENWTNAVHPLVFGRPLSPAYKLDALIKVWELIAISKVKPEGSEA
jgi:phage gp16-like protein